MTKIAFALDIDGVLIRGGRVIQRSREALRLLKQSKIPFLLFTNGGGVTERERAARLSEQFGMDISERQYLQSHTPFRNMAKDFNRVLVVGGQGDRCRFVAEEYGFRDVVLPADVLATYPSVVAFPSLSSTMVGARRLANPGAPFDGIFVFHDSRDSNADVQVIMDLLLSERGVLGTRLPQEATSEVPSVPLHFSNGDLQWASDYYLPRFGQGALISAIEVLYRRLAGRDLKHTVIGKPTRFTYEFADAMLTEYGGAADVVYMVGDNQQSDIAGANAYGWRSILVRSGVYRDGDRLYTQPDLICDDLLDGVSRVLDRA